MNSVSLVGNVCTDLDLKILPTGTAVCNFTLAVSRTFKKEGQPDSDFIRVIAFGKQAENLANYQKKGSKISVVGSIQTGSYDKDGIKTYTTDIIANQIGFLTPKSENGQSQTNNTYQNQPPAQPQYQAQPQPQQPVQQQQPPQQQQGNFNYGNGQPQQNYQWSGQTPQQNMPTQQPNYTRVDEDPFANSKGPIEVSEDDLPF